MAAQITTGRVVRECDVCCCVFCSLCVNIFFIIPHNTLIHQKVEARWGKWGWRDGRGGEAFGG